MLEISFDFCPAESDRWSDRDVINAECVLHIFPVTTLILADFSAIGVPKVFA
jgi:hypothetical protein